MFKPTREEIVDKTEELAKTKKFKEYLEKSNKSMQVRLNGFNTFFKHSNHISALHYTLNPDMETLTVALDHKANGYLVDMFSDIKVPKARAKKEEPKVAKKETKETKKVIKKATKSETTKKKTEPKKTATKKAVKKTTKKPAKKIK